MAKRSREDFEPSPSPEPSSHPITPSETASTRIVNLSSLTHHYQPSKFHHLDPSESGEEDGQEVETSTQTTQPASSSSAEMRCSLPPHKQTLSFASFEDYEVHYAKEHTHRCLECKKNFPTAHFLNLHIEENHDSLVVVRRERGEKTYNCFVVDCDRACSTPQKRRMHLIDKHAFPKDYDFYIVNDGIDRRSSMLRSGRHRRGSSAVQMQTEKARRRAGTLDGDGSREGLPKTKSVGANEMEADVKVAENAPGQTAQGARSPPAKTQYSEEVMDDLVGGISALKFIPPSVRFGRGRGRGGFSRT